MEQVVCIDDSPNPFRPDIATPLRKGTIYTVRERIDKFHLLLCEIDPPEPFKGYFALRFRPVRRTDISVLTSLLAPTPSRTLASVE